MKKKVYAYLHTHWDREWYKEFDEFRIRLVEVVDDILNKLLKNEIPSFYFDGQTSALEDYLEIKPQNEKIIKKLIQEKRLFIGPYYCSTDSLLIDSECLIRNLQIGIAQSKEFGCNNYIAYHADTFGHSRFIAEIIKYFNIDNAIFWRGLGEIEADFLFRNLKSTYLIEGYFHDYFHSSLPFEKKIEFLKRTLDRISKYSKTDILLPLGADHMACADNLKEQIKKANDCLEDYEIVISTPFDYLEAVKNNYQNNYDTEFRNPKRNFILPGVYSSRIDLKQENAFHQWNLSRVIQPIQAVFSFLKKSVNFQQETDYLFKELIKNHPHDSIYGCSTDKVHKENKTRYLKVQNGANALLNSLRRDVLKNGSYSVVNLSNFDFSGALRIKTDKKLDKIYNAQLIGKTKGFSLKKLYDIKQVPITEDYTTIYEYLADVKNIKAFSIKTLSNEDISQKSSLKITKNSLENDELKLSVENGKIYIENKKTKEIYKNFIQFTDRADVGDSYNFGALINDKPVYSKILNSKIRESGHIRSILDIKFEIEIPSKSTQKGRSKKIKKHFLTLSAILENQNKFLEFQLDWENKSTNHILQVEFNLKNNITDTVSDDLSGLVKRTFNCDYDIYKEIPAKRGIELMHNTAPMQKFVHTQNFGVVTCGLQEYEISKNNLYLTLLRATGTISNPKNPTRGTPAGPPLPTFDLQMTGKNSARFAVCFTQNPYEMYEISEKFYQTVQLFEAEFKNETLFTKGNDKVQVNTIKTDSDGNLVIRLVNKSETAQTADLTVCIDNSGVWIADALENIIKPYDNPKIPPNSYLTLVVKKSL